jgi:hypothetical protein
VVEQNVDRVVDGVGSGTLGIALVSARADEDRVDGAVEGIAEGIGFGGEQSRRIQTGMSHHYYTVVVAGAVVSVIVASIWR